MVHFIKNSILVFCIRPICLCLCFCSIISIFSLSAQRELSVQAKNAIDLFNNEKYTEAAARFKQLVSKYPKDPLYVYYLGASLVESNTSPIQAISYLNTSVSNNVDNKALYYLGKAYYRQFQFSEAISAFERLKKKSKWIESKQMGLPREQERLSVAPSFFSKAMLLDVLKKTPVATDSFSKYVESESGVRKIEINYAALFSGKSEAWNTTGLTNEYFYFSAKAQMNSRGRDIFRVKRIDETNFSEPENLGQVINSVDDEDYPFFDTLSNTLYFASKGHMSMGGYDIFSSKYNNITKEWGKPEQIPFPVNSQWNDFGWINTADFTLFVSDRSSSVGKINVYKTVRLKDAKFIDLKDVEEMVQANSLEVNTKKTLAKKEVKRVSVELNNVEPSVLAASINSLGKALEMQRQCDSLLLLSRIKRKALANAEEKETRNVLFSEIAKIEKMASKLQKPINEYYSKLFEVPKNTDEKKKELSKQQANVNMFKFEGASPYSSENPIPVGLQLPEGIVYRIQLGVYSKSIPQSHFGGLQPVTAEYLQDGKIIKYYVGIFGSFEKADSSLKKVKNMGFKEAFVIAYYNNRKIPLERAKGMEDNNN
jgi:tetratricopeptide (TPR) repeat protein